MMGSGVPNNKAVEDGDAERRGRKDVNFCLLLQPKKLWEVETLKAGEGKMFNTHPTWTTRDDTHWNEHGGL